MTAGELPPAASQDTWRDRHGADVAAALGDGDARDIKRLYVQLGDMLDDAYRTDLDAVPQLSLPETVPVVLELLEGSGARLLDAGCGPLPVASIAAARADPARWIVALDLGLGTVRLARAKATASGVTVSAVVGDLEALPFRSGAFDAVVCDDTIEHVPDDTAGVRELMRMIGTSGCVVLATPNRRSLAVLRQRVSDAARGRRRPPSHYFVAESHLREYTWKELAALLAPVAVVERRATVGWRGRAVSRAVTKLIDRPVLRSLDRMLVVRLGSR